MRRKHTDVTEKHVLLSLGAQELPEEERRALIETLLATRLSPESELQLAYEQAMASLDPDMDMDQRSREMLAALERYEARKERGE
jgi:hypothetical protein